MQSMGPKKVVHGGTYASNPVSLAAADATLDEIVAKNVHKSIGDFGAKLMKGIKQILEDHQVDAAIQGFPSMFQLLFTDLDEVTNYRDLKFCDSEAFARLRLELLMHGVMVDEDDGEPIFASYSHTMEDLDKALETALSHALEEKPLWRGGNWFFAP